MSLLTGRRRLRALLTLTAASVAALGLTSVASAGPFSSDSDHDAMAAALGVSPECVDTWTSTTDPAWVQLLANDNDCLQADGVVLLHRDASGWQVAYEGPADTGPCPINPAVPDAVAREFGLCFTPSKQTYVPVGISLRARPRLMIQGAHGAYGKLRWQGWGRSVATARGRLEYDDAYTRLRVPVKITLSHLGYCGHRRTYLRQHVAAVRAADRSRLRGWATGTLDVNCPDSE